MRSNTEGQTPPVAPWVAEPYRLWSLYDMLQFYAQLFARYTTELAKCTSLLMVPVQQMSDQQYEWLRGQVKENVANLAVTVEDLPLSAATRGQLARLNSPELKFEKHHSDLIAAQITELLFSIAADLHGHMFLYIRPERSEYYAQNEPPFGQTVADRFPEANPDISAASRCIAFEEWTAAVFHLMRVVGYGLRDLARTVDVPMAATFDYVEWGQVIDQIESKVVAMRRQARSREKADSLEFYSKVLTQCRYFKDAWRLSVSHMRGKYDEREAITVFQAVGEFMRLVASDVPQTDGGRS